jgi:hypothetical protein
MQIDFHHTVTYVVARAAGFDHPDAEVLAYSAQYVDDAIVKGPVNFDIGAMYMRISSAHKSLDPENLDNHENRMVWQAFHFLPGNGGRIAGEDPPGSFIDKLVCTPDSPIAREMLSSCINNQEKPYSLHRLGVTMHVYADTFAHQGFAGVSHEINKVRNAGAVDSHSGLLQTWGDRLLEGVVPPVGHGRAQFLPDLPFLTWHYSNWRDVYVERNNTDTFLQAADAMCKAMRRYRQKDATADVIGLTDGDTQHIRELFLKEKDTDPTKRHQNWLKAIGEGQFSFGSVTLEYADLGPTSWKAQALGTSDDRQEYPYRVGFLNMNWKLFHDALQLHRLIVLHDILPKYGICSG